MTAHKYAEMIKAKADNMDLVVLVRTAYGGNWAEVDNGSDLPSFRHDNEYFLCLQKHKEACLHWLNGGEVQNNISEPLRQDAWIPFCGFSNKECEPWSVNCNFMREQSNFRIKPRKEKRWIVAKPNALVSMMYFKSKTDADDAVKYSTGEFKGGQVIEIEVEV